MSINVTIERIDSCKLFNKMTKKFFTKEKKCPFDKLALKLDRCYNPI